MYFFTNRGNQFGRGAVRETRASPRKDAGETVTHALIGETSLGETVRHLTWRDRETPHLRKIM